MELLILFDFILCFGFSTLNKNFFLLFSKISFPRMTSSILVKAYNNNHELALRLRKTVFNGIKFYLTPRSVYEKLKERKKKFRRKRVESSVN